MPETFEDPTQLMKAWARAVTDNDPHLLGDVFAADAEFVNLFGSVWLGRQAIVEGHQWALSSVLKDSTMDFDSVNLRAIDHQAVVMRGVCRRGRRENASAETLAPGTTVLLMVAQQGHDGWRAIAGANVAQQAPTA